MRDKLKLTERLVEELPEEFKESVDLALKTWWINIRKNGGMRLTEHGFYVLSRVLNLAHYGIEVKPITNKRVILTRIILTLDRKLQMPYYIEVVKHVPVKVYMFGSREAVAAQLYGDIEKFLESY